MAHFFQMDLLCGDRLRFLYSYFLQCEKINLMHYCLPYHEIGALWHVLFNLKVAVIHISFYTSRC
jgi:hypothetical protein